jgi:3-isopropylmalate/(R)-2-methylmalate dehydratase small subunit
MNALRQVAGPAAILDRADVDTDQIIPKQFLKRIERSGFGEFLFYDWMKDPAFELRQPEAQGASILIAGANFGCGSSREHAPWALEDYGFRVIFAPSFGDIFRTNSVKTGIAPIALGEAELDALKAAVRADRELTVDLETLTVSHAGGLQLSFAFDPFEQHLLVNGLDDVALTLARADRIDAFESSHPGRFDGRAVLATALGT